MTKTTQLLTRPLPGTIVKPVYEYDEGQKEKLQALCEVSLCILGLLYDSQNPSTYLPPTHLSLLVLQYAYSLHLPDDDAYAPWERRWLDRPDTIARYMRASKWKLDEARKRIKGTIEWRREFQPELIPPDEVKIEAATGKM
jgi:hypothetical protein